MGSVLLWEGLPARMLQPNSLVETFCPKNLSDVGKCFPPPPDASQFFVRKFAKYIRPLNSVLEKYKKERQDFEARQKEALSEHSMERVALIYFVPFLTLQHLTQTTAV